VSFLPLLQLILHSSTSHARLLELFIFFFKESRVPFSYLVACWRFRREEGGGGRDGNEKRDREEEERVRPRALNVNLGNQIKAVSFFLSRGVAGDASERRKIRKRGGGEKKRGRRVSDGPHQRQYPTRTRKRRICRARAGGGQSFSALCLLNNILVSVSGLDVGRARNPPSRRA